MNQKVKNMVGIGVFAAIVIALQLLGGGIKVGTVFSISLVLLPIVVGAALYQAKAGAILGFVFGVAVLLSGDAALFLAVDPVATVGVVLVKGTLAGLFAGYTYQLVSKWNKYAAVVVSAIVCPVVNTGVFLLGCKLFFLETVTQWAAMYGYADAANYMIFGLAGVNFLIELGVNIVLSPVIVRLIRLGVK